MNQNQKDYNLYHYCNTEIFNSIIINKEFWMSDITKMNDPTEMKWARNVFVKTLKEYKNLFTIEFRWLIIQAVFDIDKHILPLIGCFSINGDLQNQWNMYAKRGTGLSIGFSSNTIHNGFGVNSYPITYDLNEQKQIILRILIRLFIFFKDDPKEFDFHSPFFALNLNYLKNPKYKEEEEIRIVRVVVKDEETKALKDVGGNSEINKIAPLPIFERKVNGKKISYIKLPITVPNHQTIKEVIIGPNSDLTILDVEEFLNSNGFKNVIVRKSAIFSEDKIIKQY